MVKNDMRTETNGDQIMMIHMMCTLLAVDGKVMEHMMQWGVHEDARVY